MLTWRTMMGTRISSTMSRIRHITANTVATATLRLAPRACRRSTSGSPNQPSSAAMTNGVRIGESFDTSQMMASATATHCTLRMKPARVASEACEEVSINVTRD